MMKLVLACAIAAVEASRAPGAFLQMGLKTQRMSTMTKWGDDEYDGDDMVYGENGFSDSAMDDSDTLGVHEFIEAADDSQVDDSDESQEEIEKQHIDDETTNFGADADPTDKSYSEEEEVDEDAE